MTNPTTVPDPYEGDRGLRPETGLPATGSTAAGTGSVGGGFDDFSAGSTYSTGAGEAGGSSSTKDVAKEEAAHTKQAAAGAASQVASTAKSELGNVTAEASGQAKDLLHQARGQVREQLGSQQNRLAGSLHSVAKDLGSMGASSDAPSFVTDLVQEAANRVGAVGHWLENREPADLLDEVRNFARRKPGTFLLSAAIAGAVVGRITRNAAAVARQDTQGTTGAGVGTGTYVAGGTTGYSDTGYGSTGYADPAYTTSDYTVPATGYDAGTSQGLGTAPYDPTLPTTGTTRGDVTP